MRPVRGAAGTSRRERLYGGRARSARRRALAPGPRAHAAPTSPTEDLDWLHLLLADWQLARRPVVRRPGAVAARPARPAAASSRPRRSGRRPGRRRTTTTWSAPRSPRGRRPQLDTRVRRAADLPGARPGLARRRAGARGDDPGACAAGRVVAVVSRHTNLAAARTPSRLELTYLRTADDLARDGLAGPLPGARRASHQVALAPRVGDGLIRLDERGIVTFASPNARVGVPPARAGRRPGRAPTWATSRPALAPAHRPGRRGAVDGA